MTQPQAATALSASTAKVAKMERGWVPIRDPDILALCDLYEVRDRQTVDNLLSLAKADRERRKARGWWNEFPELRAMVEYVALEAVATNIRTWQLSYIPGLFQTPDYFRALATSDTPWHNPHEQRFLEARIARQARLTSKSPLQVWAVVWEGALRQWVGGREVMRAQLEHLARLATELPNVKIQVLPFRAGAHPGMVSAFGIISFAEPGAMDVVFMDSTSSTLWLEGEEDAARHAEIFDCVTQLALDPVESASLINHIHKEYERCPHSSS